MKRAICLLLAVLMCAALFGCGSKPSSSNPSAEPTNNVGADQTQTGAEKDSLIVSLATELQTLSIFGQQNIITNEVLTNIYDGLLVLDQDANIAPNVAES